MVVDLTREFARIVKRLKVSVCLMCSAFVLRSAFVLLRTVLLVLTVLCSTSALAQQVEVRLLFKGSAVLEIDGKHRTVKEGKTTPEGVTLVEATSKYVVVDINGKREKLVLSRRVGGTYKDAGKSTVRIASSAYGHYVTGGQINRRSVQFMVDTGATSISLSSVAAERIGLSYSNGEQMRVGTANGNVTGYRVLLSSVSVGSISLTNIEAIVIEGEFPEDVLLGNSFLSRVEMKVDQGAHPV